MGAFHLRTQLNTVSSGVTHCVALCLVCLCPVVYKCVSKWNDRVERKARQLDTVAGCVPKWKASNAVSLTEVFQRYFQYSSDIYLDINTNRDKCRSICLPEVQETLGLLLPITRCQVQIDRKTFFFHEAQDHMGFLVTSPDVCCQSCVDLVNRKF
nr:ORF27 [Bracoviriform inaniti]